MPKKPIPHAVFSKSKKELLVLAFLLLFGSTSLAQADSLSAPERDSSSQETVLASAGQEIPAASEESGIPASQELPALAQASDETVLASEQVSSPLSLDQYQKADASSLAEQVRSGQVTSEELLDLALESIAKTNPELNSVISLRADEARKEAQALVDKGQPFLGVPILVKGLGHSIKGGESSNGLSFMKDSTSKTTGAYVKALQEAGFIVVGQSNYPEMGWINVTNSDSHGINRNPWNLDHNPGGSSGGSAAAVSVGQVPLASASDGGGSIRIPASWSGLVGFFPTLGVTAGNTASEHGQVVNFAMTRTMRDTETLFNALLKKEVLPNQLQKDQPIAYTTKTPAGTPISPDAVQAVKQAVDFLRSQGYQLVEVDYPVDGEQLMKSYYSLAANSAKTVNFLANQKLKRNLQKDDVELLTWALYQAGKDLSKEDMDKTYQHIAKVRQQMTDFYQQYPIFLTPTNAYPAPEANYHHIPQNLVAQLSDMSNLTQAEKMQLIYDQWLPAWTLTPFTQLANLTQTPAISLPTYVTAQGLPLGIMFNTYKNNDRSLLALGRLFEEANLFQTLYQHRGVQEDDKDPSNLPLDSGEDLVGQSPHSQLVGQLTLGSREEKGDLPIKASSQTKLPETGQKTEAYPLVGLISLLGLFCLRKKAKH
ncbi:amidase family protein [Streptococcus oricebi]|uniref:Amidase n=1 Tax=Streptococcus oricebi TaxID=1547447 RepID=A0ABS5B4F2_9STRE|nr:amidase family protein [Streptococcus oricebi]MBP2623630.1 amidase [Streptococcus oricebi]